MTLPQSLHPQGKPIACKITFFKSEKYFKSKSNSPFYFFRDTESIIGLVIFILCVLYSSIRTASNSQAAKLSGAENILLKDNGEGSNADPEANKVWDNEEDEVAYSCKIYLIFLERILETKSISFFSRVFVSRYVCFGYGNVYFKSSNYRHI